MQTTMPFLRVSATGATLANPHRPRYRLQAVVRLKTELLRPAIDAARAAGLHEHIGVLSLLQIALPAVDGKAMTGNEVEAIAYATSLITDAEITAQQSVTAGQFMRQAGLDLTSVSQRNAEGA